MNAQFSLETVDITCKIWWP